MPQIAVQLWISGPCLHTRTFQISTLLNTSTLALILAVRFDNTFAMDASTRLYTRLGEIPDDPEDPESLDDLLVCAFGAFERFYVCWKTRGGDYRQDSYDLPPALKDWLYPTDGSSRDHATLQVVFGRGEEYFASDKNGKLEFKEPEVKKPAEEDKPDKAMLRRSRTMSLFRPISRTSTTSDVSSPESTRGSRSSSISSQRAARPPSLSSSRTSSDSIPIFPKPLATQSSLPSHRANRSSLSMQWPAELEGPRSPVRVTDVISEASYESERSQNHQASPMNAFNPRPLFTPRSKAASVSQSPEPKPEKIIDSAIHSVPRSNITSKASCTCTCGHGGNNLSVQQPSRPGYSNASVQTDPEPSRSALHINTSPGYGAYDQVISAATEEIQTLTFEDSPDANPILMGRMGSYFGKPGYQLGDSLFSSYSSYPSLFYHDQEDGFD